MSMRRFIVSDETDDNVAVYVRELSGSMTEARRNIVDTFVKRYNQDNSAPYGVSPNGYPCWYMTPLICELRIIFFYTRTHTHNDSAH
jgi:hypothetical protein